MTPKLEWLDDFRDLSAWHATASGQAELALAADAGPDGHAAMRLDYDFKGGGGFVVARRSLARTMPQVWALSLRLRGVAPANKFELKFADRRNRNVWWWWRNGFEFPADWQALRVRSSEVTFAWGPAGGGTLREMGAIEVAFAAPPGGSGKVWISDLRIEDLSLAGPPRVAASSAQPGHEPEHALQASSATSWRSATGAAPAWLALDFGREHEYGGLVIDWGAGAPRAFEVQRSDDGAAWQTLASATQADGERSYVYLPGGACSRHLRLHFPARGADLEPAHEVRRLDVHPFDFSRSLTEFFHGVAACEPRGHYPRWLHREQSYWTPVGVAGGTTAAILNEEGLFEPDRGSFSLEPFLHAGGQLITWADAEVSVSLAHGVLPIPSCTWRHGDLTLTITTYAAVESGQAQARAVYRVANAGAAARAVRLFVALRPFQVSPPWQSFQGIGGTSPIHSLAWRDGAVWVNGTARVIPRTAPKGFGAAAFEQGSVVRHLAHGVLPPRDAVEDGFAHASGALCWDLDVAPGRERAIEVAVPFTRRPALGPVTTTGRDAAPASLGEAERLWERKLGGVRIRIGGEEPTCVRALRTAAAHVLICRDGPALQPGPRRYTRAWIRDAATMSAALLRMGCIDEVRDFLAWYVTHQAVDGNVPCVVDRNGPDWLPEHDSHGQLVFTLAECFRFSGDRDFVSTLWPHAQRTIGYLEHLLATRRTAQFRAHEQRARYGILPESASHEGYLAQPVHAYWDDFWALRGIADGAELAQALGDTREATRLTALRDELGRCLYASIEATIRDRGLAYIPGSVEWADPDPSATATAIAISDAAARLPPNALAWTFDDYMRTFRRRRSGTDWNNYSAYEIRIIVALVRLGRRADAHELLEFFLANRRPLAWNQWPEISWRELRSPGHLGDVPHAWIGAEYLLAVLGMFAYERASDSALVIAGGISDAWLDRGDIAIEGLPTWWGPLACTICREGPGALRLDLAPGLAVPPGGIVVRAPLQRPLARVEVDGHVIENHDALGPTLRRAPASIVLRY